MTTIAVLLGLSALWFLGEGICQLRDDYKHLKFLKQYRRK